MRIKREIDDKQLKLMLIAAYCNGYEDGYDRRDIRLMSDEIFDGLCRMAIKNSKKQL